MAGAAPNTVRIEGLSKLRRDLKVLDAELAKEVPRISRKAAEMVVPFVLKEVPVGTAAEGDKHPGLLKRTVRAGATARSGFVKAGGARAPYAAPIHFGWQSRNIAPNLFIYRGLAEAAPEVERFFAVEIDLLVKRAIEFEGA